MESKIKHFLNDEPNLDCSDVDWSRVDLSKVPKVEEKDYCNEFQDNQTTYACIDEPRTEEEAKAEKDAKLKEAEEAKEDDKCLTTDETNKDDQISKTDYPFKYILKYTEKGDLERVGKCIQRFPHSINARDSDGYTPLHRACHNDNVELVKLLIDNGSDVEAKTGEGWRPIHCAAYWGNVNVVDFLIRYGVNINALTNGNNTCLHFAVQRYERHLLELLIYHPLMYIDVKNGSNDNAYDLCKRKTDNYQLFHNLLNENAY